MHIATKCLLIDTWNIVLLSAAVWLLPVRFKPIAVLIYFVFEIYPQYREIRKAVDDEARNET